MTQSPQEPAQNGPNPRETVNNAFSMVKWVAIAVIVLVVAGLSFATYRVLTAPARIAADTAQTMSESVKSGSMAAADKAKALINRLSITSEAPERINRLAEMAFPVLSAIAPIKPDGIKARLFRRTHLPGSQDKVCTLSLDFGHGALPLYTAADNKAFATSKALGGQAERRMRLIIVAPDDTVGFTVEWATQTKDWTIKWQTATVKKPVSDTVAANRIMDILTAIPQQCTTP